MSLGAILWKQKSKHVQPLAQSNFYVFKINPTHWKPPCLSVQGPKLERTAIIIAHYSAVCSNFCNRRRLSSSSWLAFDVCGSPDDVLAFGISAESLLCDDDGFSWFSTVVDVAGCWAVVCAGFSGEFCGTGMDSAAAALYCCIIMTAVSSIVWNVGEIMFECVKTCWNIMNTMCMSLDIALYGTILSSKISLSAFCRHWRGYGPRNNA